MPREECEKRVIERLRLIVLHPMRGLRIVTNLAPFIQRAAASAMCCNPIGLRSPDKIKTGTATRRASSQVKGGLREVKSN